MSDNPEIPDEAVERFASLLHGLEHDRLNSRCPGSDDCQLWYDAEFRAAALENLMRLVNEEYGWD